MLSFLDTSANSAGQPLVLVGGAILCFPSWIPPQIVLDSLWRAVLGGHNLADTM